LRSLLCCCLLFDVASCFGCLIDPRQLAASLIPPDENSFTKWNGGPYDLDGGSGYSEDDAGAFLVSYWAGRYFGFLQD
jgi:hypothetical protein